MQFQADMLGVPVVRPQVTETTALGAAYFAGLATGFWASPEELRAKRQGDMRFEPKMGASERAERRGRWQRAVERAKGLERVNIWPHCISLWIIKRRLEVLSAVKDTEDSHRFAVTSKAMLTRRRKPKTRRPGRISSRRAPRMGKGLQAFALLNNGVWYTGRNLWRACGGNLKEELTS